MAVRRALSTAARRGLSAPAANVPAATAMVRPAAKSSALSLFTAGAGTVVVATTALAPTETPRCSGLMNVNELAAVVRDTNFTMPEVVRLKNKFDRIEGSGGGLGTGISQGYITGVEFASFFSKELSMSHGHVSHLYNLFDKDNSGKIDFAEFASTCSKLVKGTPIMKIGFFFRTADTNDSGSLDKAELGAMVHVLVKVCKSSISETEMTAAIFNEADANHDGKIDIAEIIAWSKNNSEQAVRLRAMMSTFGHVFLDN